METFFLEGSPGHHHIYSSEQGSKAPRTFTHQSWDSTFKRREGKKEMDNESSTQELSPNIL